MTFNVWKQALHPYASWKFAGSICADSAEQAILIAEVRYGLTNQYMANAAVERSEYTSGGAL
jgi:hypothetical protein